MYWVDAFAQRLFEGNPAVVCPLPHWMNDDILQAIAAENNLSETAFIVPQGDAYHLRWFTPVAEMDLCGHATLATAHVLYAELGETRPALHFDTLSGRLTVTREGQMLAMDFPARPATPCVAPEALLRGLGATPREVLVAADYMAVFDSEDDVRAIVPNVQALGELDRRGVIVTAPGRSHDFVSRFFAPSVGIAEDPVTGSAHCTLAPYWSERLGKTSLHARQVSKRGGDVRCRIEGSRVVLAGQAVVYMVGEVRL